MLPVLFDQAQQLADSAREALGRLNGQGPGFETKRDPGQSGITGPASLIDLSDAARRWDGEDTPRAGGPGLAAAIGRALDRLRQDAAGTFEGLGMDRRLAEQAATALGQAVGGKLDEPEFSAQLSSLTATQESTVTGNGFYYAASMTLRQVELSYDQESGVFTASVVQVSISVEVASGSMINRMDPMVLDLSGMKQDLREAQQGLFFDPKSSLIERFDDQLTGLKDLASLLVFDADQEDLDEDQPPQRLQFDAVLPVLLARDAVNGAVAETVDVTA